MKSALIRIVSVAFLLFLFLFPPRVSAATENRTALVVGNAAYSTGALKNPANDAADMAAQLTKLGFKVTLLKNAKLQEMDEAIEAFGKKLKQGGVGLFFYAGHGVRVKGANYLIPVDARINKETDLKYRAVDANRVLDEMGNAKNGLNIVILDACRDNPFSRNYRSTTRGLAVVSSAPTGTYISYSTSPGSVAQDGKGRNSPYTAALLENMQQPGVGIEQVFKHVRVKLDAQTRGKQVPWELSSLKGDFYFVPGATGEKTAAAAPALLPATPSAAVRDDKAPKSAVQTEKPQKEIKNDGRFIDNGNGTVTDTRTGLMWAARDNGSNINWSDAKSYCKEYRGGGYTDWRMPTQNELNTLFDREIEGINYYRLTASIHLTNCCAWAAENIWPSANFFDFEYGSVNTALQSNASNSRVLPVRSAGGTAPKAASPPKQTIDELFASRTLGAAFVFVPAGTFTMGGKGSDEKPHQVTISRPFYMQTTEVTQAQWKRVMGNNPSYFKDCGDDCPVEQVSWDDVQEFIRRLNMSEGTTLYRLPTEAEWEYAARSGGKREAYAGTSDASKLDNYAWNNDNSGNQTHPVGLKSPNGLGLYDMSGNVWEWVQDWYGDYPSGSVTDPFGPSDGKCRVYRGGAYNDWMVKREVESRNCGPSTLRLSWLGFRLVRSP